jgi:hypothetical protein
MKCCFSISRTTLSHLCPSNLSSQSGAQPSGLARIFFFFFKKKKKEFPPHAPFAPLTGPDGWVGPLPYSRLSFDKLLRVLAINDNSCIYVIILVTLYVYAAAQH